MLNIAAWRFVTSKGASAAAATQPAAATTGKRAQLHASLSTAVSTNKSNSSDPHHPVLLTSPNHTAQYTILDPAAFTVAVQKALSSAARDSRREELQVQLDAVNTKLEEVQRGVVAPSDRHAARMLQLIGLGLVVQFAVLFNWVFFVFDWNLVEPVTYFLGYTAIWWSMIFHRATAGKEFNYENLAEELAERRRRKAYARRGDGATLDALTLEQETLSNVIRRL